MSRRHETQTEQYYGERFYDRMPGRKRRLIMAELEEEVSEDDEAQRKEKRTKLLLSVEPEVAKYNDKLADQGDPEQGCCHGTALEPIFEVPLRRVGEDAFWADGVGCCCTRDHHADRSNDLREGERCADVQS